MPYNVKYSHKHRNDYRFLFLCIAPKNYDITSILKTTNYQKLNWETIYEVAYNNRLTPILYHFLSKHNLIENVPKPYNDYLKQAYYKSMQRGIVLQETYKEISKEFDKKNIEYLPLRGIIWIETLYDNNPALRPMTDIDIYVPSKFTEKAKKSLLELGFKPRERLLERYHHEVYTKKNLIIEIHSNFFVDGIIALFPDFELNNSIKKAAELAGKPLCSLHYFIHKDRPALRLYDFVRLKEENNQLLSKELRRIINKTEQIINEAESNNYKNIFFQPKHYYLSWTTFIVKSLIHDMITNPLVLFKKVLRTIKLASMVTEKFPIIGKRKQI